MDEGNRVIERAEKHWLVLEYPGNPVIRVDVRFLDRIFVVNDILVLAARDVAPRLEIAGGADVARQLAESLSSHVHTHVLPDACSLPVVCFGSDIVRATNANLYIGDFVCTISDAIRYAEVGASLPLPNGVMQAALALLALAGVPA
jgi:hypothetical protein